MSELALPLLAVGSHDEGSGKACIMNAISYLNGDHVITDMPSCTWWPLAKFAQAVNDSICTHREETVLCSDCSHKMWKLGARLIGTADVVNKMTTVERHQFIAKLARKALALVLYEIPTFRPRYIDAYDALCAVAEGRESKINYPTVYISDFKLPEEARTAMNAAHDAIALVKDRENRDALHEMLWLCYGLTTTKDVGFNKLLDHFDEVTQTTHRREWTKSDVVVVSQGMNRTDACSVAAGS